MSSISLSHEKLKKYETIILDENVLFELNAIPQMIVNQDRVIIRVNKKFTTLFGYSSQEILGKQTLILTPTKEKFLEYVKYFKETKDGIIKSEELEYKKKNGTIFWVKLEGNPINQQPEELFILWSFIDVTKEVTYRKELEKLASTDPLTTLYNRRFFIDVSKKMMATALREQQPLSILMLDIDDFKNINDTYGHDVGDQVIISLSKTLKEFSRSNDIICRWGGEEFMILLPNTSINNATNLANKIRLAIEKKILFIKDKIAIKYTVSIGVSFVFATDKNIDLAIKRTDIALYKAKVNGKNQVFSQ